MGQSYSYFNDIHAQIYNSDGTKSGGEFRVNSKNIPSTNPGESAAPSVPAAMS